MKFAKFLALFCAVGAFVACTPAGPEQPAPKGSITLSADKTTLALGDSVTFTATMEDEETGETVDVTNYVTLMDGDLNEVSNPYTPEASGHYTFMCTYGSETSNNVDITVMAQLPNLPNDPEPTNLAFNHRGLFIDHTGVGCGYCPVVVEVFRSLRSRPSHQHFNEVTVHAGGYATGDPANSQAANIVNQFHEPKSYPDVRLNFYGGNVGQNVASFEAALDRYIKKDGADVGISMAVAGDSSTIYCAAQVKAKVAQEYKVVAWLLESGIYSPNQASYIGEKDYYKIYDFALRNISGTYSRANISGESIGVLEAGKTHDCTFELPITSTKWNWEKMGVLVIVSTKTGSGSWEVANTAYCSLDDKAKAYEYVE